jgi:diacylglycerol kinase (ATP)
MRTGWATSPAQVPAQVLPRMRRRFFLVTNPTAGACATSRVADVVALLEREGAVVMRAAVGDLAATRAAARNAADNGNCDAIIAAGGDGTVRQVAMALIGCSTPLGVVPVGTGNVLAHEIGLAADPTAIANMLLGGPQVRVACALANGEPFLLMAGAGFDARVLLSLDQRWKSRIGKPAFAGPVLGTLLRPLDRLQIVLDGCAHSACWAVVSNARHYAGKFLLAPYAGIERRGLVAVLFKAETRAALTAQLLQLATGGLAQRAARTADVALIPCQKASITSRQPVPIQLDGDAFGTTPLAVDAGAAEIALIVPGRYGSPSAPVG